MAHLPPGFSSSNDVALDRRYRWAKASLDAGESDEACEILLQTLAEAPSWAPAWKLLGDALAASDKGNEARGAYERVVELDPLGHLGAKLELARLGAVKPHDAMQPGYVAALFDDYSDRFDAHLVERLGYRAPRVMLDALRETCAVEERALRFEHAIDLGCGTGLMGEIIRPFATSLTGVDLSPGMLTKARAKLVYDHLIRTDIVEFLRAAPRSGADLILAADVLVYIADLRPFFAAAATALCAGGLLAFTVQSCGDDATRDGFALGLDNRFAHSQAYLREAATSQALDVVHLKSAVTRQDAGRDVAGFAAVLARTQ